MTAQQKPPQPQPPATPFSRLTWWLIFIGLLIWNILLFWPSASPEVTIPYTTFLNQVQADNIPSVVISGDEITGKFVKPLTWPPASPTSVPATASPQPTAISSTTTSLPPGSAMYSEFSTTFPEAVGDQNLLPLLEAHKITVDVETPPTPMV